jgi:hypothetical protein
MKLASELEKKLTVTPLDINVQGHFDHESYRERARKDPRVLEMIWTLPGDKNRRMKLHPMEYLSLLDLRFPLISGVLASLSEAAKKEIENSEDVITKVNAKGSNITYFVRLMSDWCFGYFGTPCHELVSLLADSIYEKRITAEDVRGKLKGYSRRVVKNENKPLPIIYIEQMEQMEQIAQTIGMDEMEKKLFRTKLI